MFKREKNICIVLAFMLLLTVCSSGCVGSKSNRTVMAGLNEIVLGQTLPSDLIKYGYVLSEENDAKASIPAKSYTYLVYEATKSDGSKIKFSVANNTGGFQNYKDCYIVGVGSSEEWITYQDNRLTSLTYEKCKEMFGSKTNFIAHELDDQTQVSWEESKVKIGINFNADGSVYARVELK